MQFAYIENDFDMPDLWFGYEAADVVILVTRDESFINYLNSDRRRSAPQGAGGMGAPRRQTDRLRRAFAGTCVGHCKSPRQDDAHPLPDRRAARRAPKRPTWRVWAAANGPVPQAMHNVEMLRLIPGDGVTVLASESAKVGDKSEECPVVVEASCGLGRVWMTAFDLDGPPFTTWTEGQKAFWSKVQSEFTPKSGPAARAPVNRWRRQGRRQ